MMTYRTSFFVLLIMFNSFLFAQSNSEVLYYNHLNMFNWAEDRGLKTIDTNDLKEPAVILLDEDKYIFSGVKEIKHITHRIIRVNNDLGVEMYNKMYIPTTDENAITHLRVRCINPGGKIVNFDMSNIKRFDNLDGTGGYTVFAIEGIEIGGEIEYYYKLKLPFYSCNRFSLQANSNKKSSKLEFEIDSDFSFDIGMENLDQDYGSVDKSNLYKKWVFIELDSLPKHSKKDPLVFKKRMNLCFTKYTKDGYKYDLFDRSKFCKKHRDYFGLYKNSEIRKKVYSGDLKELLNKNLRKGIDELTKSLHKNFSIKGRDQSEEGGSQLTRKQFVAGASMLLKKMRIPHSIYAVGNRYVNNYDSGNRSLSYYDMDAFLIHFIDEKLLWDPSCEYCESYYVPYRYLDQELVYIGHFKAPFVYDANHAFNNLSHVPTPGCDFSTRRTNINLSFDDDLTAHYSFYQNIQGYYSINLKSWYRYHNGTGERFEKHIKETLEDFGDSPEVLDFDVSENEKKEIVLKANMKDESIAKKLGDKLMLNIGSIIGIQSEMYDSVKRVNPIIQRYPKKYKYEIRIKIPDGYEYLSSQNVDLNDLVKRNSKNIFGWNSKYTIEGEEVIIRIEEFYDITNVKVDEIPKYRSVINQAADFNKAVIFFKKK